jgi:hypothetical protein
MAGQRKSFRGGPVPKRRVARHEVTQPSDPSYRLIPLTQGQNAIVDVADYDWLNQWNWQAHWNKSTHGFYAVRATEGQRGRLIRMHRLILGCARGEEGDHKNSNSLDNRRNNLRRCTHQQNNNNKARGKNNTSGFKGVCKTRGTWFASIYLNGVQISIGYFEDII